MFLTRKKKFSACLQKLFLPVSEPFFHFSLFGNAMFAFKASLVHFTLIELSGQGRLALLSEMNSFREIRSTQNFLLQESLKIKKFAWVSFHWGYNRKQVCLKIPNVTMGKDVTKNCTLQFHVNSIK